MVVLAPEDDQGGDPPPRRASRGTRRRRGDGYCPACLRAGGVTQPLVTAAWLRERLGDAGPARGRLPLPARRARRGRSSGEAATSPAPRTSTSTAISRARRASAAGIRCPTGGLRGRGRRAGIGPDTLVIAYDEAAEGGAARLWWLLRHFGHDRGAVLDGGLRGWREAGGPLRGGRGGDRARRLSAPRRPADRHGRRATEAARGRGRAFLDARAPERYAREVEPIDPVAGASPARATCRSATRPGGRFLRPTSSAPASRPPAVRRGRSCGLLRLGRHRVPCSLPPPRSAGLGGRRLTPVLERVVRARACPWRGRSRPLASGALSGRSRGGRGVARVLRASPRSAAVASGGSTRRQHLHLVPAAGAHASCGSSRRRRRPPGAASAGVLHALSARRSACASASVDGAPHGAARPQRRSAGRSCGAVHGHRRDARPARSPPRQRAHPASATPLRREMKRLGPRRSPASGRHWLEWSRRAERQPAPSPLPAARSHRVSGGPPHPRAPCAPDGPGCRRRPVPSTPRATMASDALDQARHRRRRRGRPRRARGALALRALAFAAASRTASGSPRSPRTPRRRRSPARRERPRPGGGGPARGQRDARRRAGGDRGVRSRGERRGGAGAARGSAPRAGAARDGRR